MKRIRLSTLLLLVAVVALGVALATEKVRHAREINEARGAARLKIYLLEDDVRQYQAMLNACFKRLGECQKAIDNGK